MNSLDDFRNKLDNDSGLAGKRRLVTYASLVLLSLNFSGASIEEANTFLFKISFSNHDGIVNVLSISVFFLMLRYYAYAQDYHKRLFGFWSNRMLRDWRVMRHDDVHHEVKGLLGKKIDFLTIEVPGILECKYEVYFPFIRKLSYITEENVGVDGELVSISNLIHLNKFSSTWSVFDYLEVLRYELLYQSSALIKSRETLDLFGPYILGVSALASLCMR